MNAARAAASAGAAATVVGRVGADAAGDLVAAALAEHGIEARLAHDPELTTGAAVAMGSSVVAHRGANARLSLTDIPEPLEADALLVSGFALFQRGSAAAARAALARFAGHWAAVDLASPTLAAAADLNELQGVASVVLATADEARAATGAEPEEAAGLLASRFAVACVKLGVEGVIAARGDRIERARAGRIAAYSAFGSGDAFAGVLLVSLARDDSLARALGLACEAGARSAAEPRD